MGHGKELIEKSEETKTKTEGQSTQLKGRLKEGRELRKRYTANYLTKNRLKAICNIRMEKM